MFVSRSPGASLFFLPVLLVSLFAAGCSTTTTQSFNVVKDSRVETSLIAVGADFSKYDRLDAADMGIFFPADAAPSVADQQRIRQIFREAFLSRLSDYEVVRGQEGPTTLRVQATLVDFRNASARDIMTVRRELRDMAQPGKLIFLMELKDSESGDILARAADSAAAPAFSSSAEIPTDWAAVEDAAARWATLFRQFLDDNLNK